MKIAIDIRPLENNPAGIGFFVKGLLTGLEEIQNDDNQYLLFSSKKIPASVFPIALSKQKFQFRNFQVSELFWYVKVWQNCKKEKVDYFYSPHSNLFSFFPKIKTILAVNDLSAILFPELHTLKVRLLAGKLFLRHALKKASLIITPSLATQNDLIKFFPFSKEKIKVVYYGLPISNCQNKNNSNNLKNRFSSIDFPYLFYLGTLEPRKNLERVINAFSELKKEKKISDKLIISGKKGWFYEKFFFQIEKLHLEDEIIFTDYINEFEKEYLFSHADLFIFPSLYEGFGFPVLEAMNHSVLLVTSNISSLPEILGPEYPFFVDPYDINDIKAKIFEALNLLQAEKKKLLERNLEISKNFTWKKHARKFLSLLEENI